MKDTALKLTSTWAQALEGYFLNWSESLWEKAHSSGVTNETLMEVIFIHEGSTSIRNDEVFPVQTRAARAYLMSEEGATGEGVVAITQKEGL